MTRAQFCHFFCRSTQTLCLVKKVYLKREWPNVLKRGSTERCSGHEAILSQQMQIWWGTAMCSPATISLDLHQAGTLLVHCCTLSLCYLGAETDDHQRNPNIKNKDHIVGDYFSVSRTQVQTKLFRPLALPLHFCIFPPLLQVGLSCQQARGCASTKFLH